MQLKSWLQLPLRWGASVESQKEPGGHTVLNICIAQRGWTTKLRSTTSLTLLTIGAVALSTAAMGQSAAPSNPNPKRLAEKAKPSRGIEEVVVTAQKRSERINHTPLAIIALSSAALADRQVSSFADLVAVSPGVRNSQQNGVNRLYIRGIGLSSFAVGADPSVAFYDDGLYIGRPSEQLTSFFDVSRLEILRGPQATLYGRNATGGTVNLYTNSPTDVTHGYLNSTFGNYGLYQFDGALSGAILKGGVLDGRIAFQTVNHDGYGTNLFNNEDINNENKQSVRVTLLARPVGWFTDEMVGLYSHENDRDYATAQFGGYGGIPLTGTLPPYSLPLVTDSQNISVDGTEANRRLTRGITNTATVDLGTDWQLKSITGWRMFKRYNDSDSDGTAANLLDTNFSEQSQQVSQSFQLNYTTKRLIVVSGLDYYHEDIANNSFVPFAQFGPTFFYIQNGTMKTDAYDGYSQGTYTVIPRLRFIAGGRYTVESRSTDGSFFFGDLGDPAARTPAAGSKRWYSFTPKGGIDFDVTQDILAYASITKGFKSGTFDIGQVNPPINPEKVTAYEVGLKSSFLDHRLDITTAAFYYSYSNLQVNKIIGLATETVNAASATNKGLEFSLKARPIRSLTIDADFSYLDAEFDVFDSIDPVTNINQDLSGKQLPGAPRWSGNLGAEYVFSFESGADLSLRVDGSFRSKIYFSEFNDSNLESGGVVKMDALARYTSPSGHWSISMWGKNITNRFVVANKILGVALYGYPIYGAVEPPATFGATLGYKF